MQLCTKDRKIHFGLFFITVLLMILFFAAPASAASGTGWNLNETTGALTITSQAGLDNWTVAHKGYVYYQTLKTVTISGVTGATIPEKAFALCEKLTTVTLTNSTIKAVKKYAFNNCTSLTTIDLSGVSTFEDFALMNCTSLASIELSTSAKWQEYNTANYQYNPFVGCTGCTRVKVGNRVFTVEAAPANLGTAYIYPSVLGNRDGDYDFVVSATGRDGASFLRWGPNADDDPNKLKGTFRLNYGTAGNNYIVTPSKVPTGENLIADFGYQMVYSANGGSYAPGQPGSPFTTPTQITVLDKGSMVKGSALFNGWNTAADGSGTNYPVGHTFLLNSSLLLYAQWLDMYSITYSGNNATGGSAPTDANPYYPTDDVIVKGNEGDLVKTGFTFKGWNTLANGTGTTYQPGSTINLSTSTTLYALWQFVPVDANGIIPGFTSPSAVGVDITLSGTISPADASYQNIVWSIKDAGGTGATLGADGCTLSTAAAGTVTVTATINGGGNGGANYTQDFVIVINPQDAPPVISPTTANVGPGGSYTFTADGYPAATFSVPNIGAMAWLTFDAQTGTIAVDENAVPGAHTFTVKATNGIAPDDQKTFTLNVTQDIAITSAASATVAQGKSFTATATGFPAPAFALSGSVPAGVAIDPTTGVLTVPDTVATGDYSFTITASNGNVCPDDTQVFSLKVVQEIVPAITSSDKANVAPGGSCTLTATGYPAPIFSLENAPTGVAIDPVSGELTVASDVAPGNYNFTVKASNGIGEDATQPFSLNVTAQPEITSASSATVPLGQTFAVAATGCPAPTFALSGSVPAGVSINAATGVLSVSDAVAEGDYSFTITASNGVGTDATQTFGLKVVPQDSAPVITTTSADVAPGGTFDIIATGYPAPTFTLSGAPSGVTIDSQTGKLSVGDSVAPGNYNFTVTADNGIAPASTVPFSLNVTAQPEITSASSATVPLGQTFAVAATGCPAPTFALSGSVPAGVSINAATGVLSVSDAVAEGDYSFTITASNGVGTDATQTFGLKVVPQDSAPVITTTSADVAPGGTFDITATGYPAPTFTLNGAPSGVTIDSQTGKLSVGDSVAPGNYNFTVTADNGIAPASTVPFSLNVTAQPEITSASSATVPLGQTFAVAATGCPTPTFALSGSVPAGVSINASTGVITVDDTVTEGDYSFTITASNGVGTDATQTFALKAVREVAPVITTTSANVAPGGTFDIIATGYPAPTFTLNGAPSGVTIDSQTGRLTVGDNVAPGNYSFTVTADNGVTPASTATFSLNVTQDVAITSAASATVAKGHTFTATATGFPVPTFYLSGNVPNGVTIDGDTGVITVPDTVPVGDYSFTIEARNGVSADASQTFALKVVPQDEAPVITTTSADVAPGGSFTIAATGYPASTFTLNGAPAGVTIDSQTGKLSVASDVVPGHYSFTVTADNGVAPASTVTFGLNVTEEAKITSAASKTLSPGETFTATATGFPAPTFGLSGNVPAGVSIDGDSGVITVGGNVAEGDYSFTITAVNGVGSPANQAFSLKIVNKTAPVITTSSANVAPGGTCDITATGYPAPTFTLNGAPVGVTIDGQTGRLSVGEGVAPGNYSFTVTADNGISPASTIPFSLNVTQDIKITSSASATVAQGKTLTVTAEGFPAPTFALSGSVPPGVTINSDTGVITVPDTVAAGDYSFTVTASNGVCAAANQTLSLKVVKETAPAITSSASASVAPGGTYDIIATGQPAPTFALSGNVPAGVTIDAATGKLTVASNVKPGSYGFTITASNGIGADATQTFSLNVTNAPIITSAAAAEITVGGTFTVTATGHPAPSFSLSGAPAGVSIDGATGVLTVAESVPLGDHTFTIIASNGIAPDGSQTFTLTALEKPVKRTVTDTTTGVGVSGDMLGNTKIRVSTNNVLHHDCSVCELIRKLKNAGHVLCLFEIDLVSPANEVNQYTVILPVGNKFNGKKLTVLHCNAGTLDRSDNLTITGSVHKDVNGLSPFAVLDATLEDIIGDPAPKTGDDFPTLWLALILTLGILGLSILSAARMKQGYKAKGQGKA